MGANYKPMTFSPTVPQAAYSLDEAPTEVGHIRARPAAIIYGQKYRNPAITTFESVVVNLDKKINSSENVFKIVERFFKVSCHVVS